MRDEWTEVKPGQLEPCVSCDCSDWVSKDGERCLCGHTKRYHVQQEG